MYTRVLYPEVGGLDFGAVGALGFADSDELEVVIALFVSVF